MGERAEGEVSLVGDFNACMRRTREAFALNWSVFSSKDAPCIRLLCAGITRLFKGSN